MNTTPTNNQTDHRVYIMENSKRPATTGELLAFIDDGLANIDYLMDELDKNMKDKAYFRGAETMDGINATLETVGLYVAGARLLDDEATA